MLLLTWKSRLPSRVAVGWFCVAAIAAMLLGLFAAERRITFVGSLVLSLIMVWAGSRLFATRAPRTLIIALHLLGCCVGIAGPLSGELPVAFLVVGGIHLASSMAMWVWDDGNGALWARIMSVLAAGAGLGMPLIASHLGYLSPWVHAWTPIALFIMWAWTIRSSSVWSGGDARIGAIGMAGFAMLAVWAAVMADPWRSRSSSDRFIISYMSERVAAGDRFDQAAFMQAWDFEEDERPIMVGTGLTQVHIFCTPEGVPEQVANLAALEKAVGSGRIRLYIHPVPSSDYKASVAWTEGLLSQPVSWPDALRGKINPPPTDALKNQAEAILRGSVRAMARLGVVAAPQMVGLATGKNPYPLDPVTLEDATGSLTQATTPSGLLEGKK